MRKTCSKPDESPRPGIILCFLGTGSQIVVKPFFATLYYFPTFQQSNMENLIPAVCIELCVQFLDPRELLFAALACKSLRAATFKTMGPADTFCTGAKFALASVSTLAFCAEIGFEYNTANSYRIATENNYSETLQRLRSSSPRPRYLWWDVRTWRRTRRYPWDARTCEFAAGKGQLKTLQWLRAHDPPCPWDERTCRAAASSGNLKMLQWLRAQDPPCPWNIEACNQAACDTVCDRIRDYTENTRVSYGLSARDSFCFFEEVLRGPVSVMNWLILSRPHRETPVCMDVLTFIIAHLAVVE